MKTNETQLEIQRINAKIRTLEIKRTFLIRDLKLEKEFKKENSA